MKDNTLIFEHTYAYDLAGNRATKTFEEGETDPILHYDYDGDGLNELVNVGGTAGDKNGSRTDLVGTVGGEDNLASVVVTNTTRSEETPAQVRGSFYIARGIMLDVGTNELQVVATDKSGNTKTEPLGDTHDVNLDNTLDLDYEYDDAGRMQYIKDGVSGAYLTKYVYDDEHRLIEVIEDPDVPGEQDGDNYTVVTFMYDALGRRIQKEIYVAGSLDETVRFIYSGQNVVEEYVDDSGWVLEAEYVHGIGIDNVLTIERDSTTWYYHHDGLGSVTELTDSSGDLVQAYEYDAWGNPTLYNPDDTTILNPYMYTGRRWDSEIDLYYYRARYYDPQHGRFIQPDPIGYLDNPNLYSYVGDTPTFYVDPAGAYAVSYEGLTYGDCCPELSGCFRAIVDLAEQGLAILDAADALIGAAWDRNRQALKLYETLAARNGSTMWITFVWRGAAAPKGAFPVAATVGNSAVLKYFERKSGTEMSTILHSRYPAGTVINGEKVGGRFVKNAYKVSAERGFTAVACVGHVAAGALLYLEGRLAIDHIEMTTDIYEFLQEIRETLGDIRRESWEYRKFFKSERDSAEYYAKVFDVFPWGVGEETRCRRWRSDCEEMRKIMAAQVDQASAWQIGVQNKTAFSDAVSEWAVWIAATFIGR